MSLGVWLNEIKFFLRLPSYFLSIYSWQTEQTTHKTKQKSFSFRLKDFASSLTLARFAFSSLFHSFPLCLYLHKLGITNNENCLDLSKPQPTIILVLSLGIVPALSICHPTLLHLRCLHWYVVCGKHKMVRKDCRRNILLRRFLFGSFPSPSAYLTLRFRFTRSFFIFRFFHNIFSHSKSVKVAESSQKGRKENVQNWKWKH